MSSKKHADETTQQSEISPVAVAAETMLGDLMKCVLDELRVTQKPWQQMGEREQSDAIYRIRQRVAANVQQAVEIIASSNRPRIVATVESVTVKEGIKAVITLSKSDPQRHDLFDSAGSHVLLVVADAEEYQGGASEVHAEPDQPPLSGFDSGSHPEPLQDAA